MLITSPAKNAKFFITDKPEWPSILFQTDASLSQGQQLTWNWQITWDKFSRKGSVSTHTTSWDAKAVIGDLGGSLAVTVTGPDGASSSVSVIIVGTNPADHDITQYVQSDPEGDGFEHLLKAETGRRHFNAAGEPIKSSDNGYGMAQLTNPAPTYELCWNWQLNVQGGLKLYKTKRNVAIAYLSANKRTYTTDQLRRETICMWNGGNYHVWDEKRGWIRNSNILCANRSNIGWHMDDPENTGKSLEDLLKRDSVSMKKGVADKSKDHWRNIGVCYADNILGSP